jgi:hypothetical protein
MPKKMVDYSNTIIYKIYCKDECITDIYVGHTTNFIQRKASHKTACNNEKNDLKIYKIIRKNGGWDNWNMIEIAKYNCKDSTEARIKENEHYNQLKATLNSCPPYVDKNNYFCLTCNLQCSSSTQYDKHIKCIKHDNLKNNNINNEEYPTNTFQTKNPTIILKFYCEKCHYTTDRKCNFDTHLISKRHVINSEMGTNSKQIHQKFSEIQYCCEKCNKEFKNRSGLWKHKKNCNNDNNNTNNSNILITPQVIMELIKDNKEMKQIILKQNNTINILVKKWNK